MDLKKFSNVPDVANEPTEYPYGNIFLNPYMYLNDPSENIAIDREIEEAKEISIAWQVGGLDEEWLDENIGRVAYLYEFVSDIISQIDEKMEKYDFEGVSAGNWASINHYEDLLTVCDDIGPFTNRTLIFGLSRNLVNLRDILLLTGLQLERILNEYEEIEDEDND